MFNKEGLGGKGGDGQNVNLSGAQTYFSTPARRLLWPWIWWWGAECKRERGHGGFAGDNTFLFSESESDLSRYCQVYFCLLSVLDKACVGESTRADICVFKFRNISWEETTKMKLVNCCCHLNFHTRPKLGQIDWKILFRTTHLE